VEGIISAIAYARIKQDTVFRLMLRHATKMVIEYARNVLNLKDAIYSRNRSNGKNTVIDLMEDQKKKSELTSLEAACAFGAYPAR